MLKSALFLIERLGFLGVIISFSNSFLGVKFGLEILTGEWSMENLKFCFYGKIISS
jgi:hypothetical protein